MSDSSSNLSSAPSSPGVAPTPPGASPTAHDELDISSGSTTQRAISTENDDLESMTSSAQPEAGPSKLPPRKGRGKNKARDTEDEGSQSPTKRQKQRKTSTSAPGIKSVEEAVAEEIRANSKVKRGRKPTEENEKSEVGPPPQNTGPTKIKLTFGGAKPKITSEDAHSAVVQTETTAESEAGTKKGKKVKKEKADSAGPAGTQAQAVPTDSKSANQGGKKAGKKKKHVVESSDEEGSPEAATQADDRMEVDETPKTAERPKEETTKTTSSGKDVKLKKKKKMKGRDPSGTPTSTTAEAVSQIAATSSLTEISHDDAPQPNTPTKKPDLKADVKTAETGTSKHDKQQDPSKKKAKQEKGSQPHPKNQGSKLKGSSSTPGIKSTGTPIAKNTPSREAGTPLPQSASEKPKITEGAPGTAPKRPLPSIQKKAPAPAPRPSSLLAQTMASLKGGGTPKPTPEKNVEEKRPVKGHRWGVDWVMTPAQRKQYEASAAQREAEKKVRESWKINAVNLQENKDTYRLDSIRQREIPIPVSIIPTPETMPSAIVKNILGMTI